MKKRTMKGRTIRKLSLAMTLAAAAALIAVPATAATYKVDNGHSMAVFKIKHLGVGNFWGVLHHVTGSFDYDKAAPEKSSIKLSVRADSVFTADKKRDGHLKSPDFFNAKEFPNMTFVSTGVKKAGKQLMVTGNLTLRGKTKSVTAKVEITGEGKDPWGGYRAGFEAHLTIQRSAFGINFMPGGLGENVDLIIAMEGIQAK